VLLQLSSLLHLLRPLHLPCPLLLCLHLLLWHLHPLH